MIDKLPFPYWKPTLACVADTRGLGRSGGNLEETGEREGRELPNKAAVHVSYRKLYDSNFANPFLYLFDCSSCHFFRQILKEFGPSSLCFI